MTNYYKTNYVQFLLKGETSISIVSEDQHYIEKKIGSFDFIYNIGWYYTLEGKQVEVKRFSTILNYFFKVDSNFGWTDKEVLQAKENAKQLKKDMDKQSKIDCKEKHEKNAMDFINNILNSEVAEKYQSKSFDELHSLISNTFRYASKNTIDNVVNAILNYSVDTPIEDNTIVNEVETVETVKPRLLSFESVEGFTVNSKQFESYKDAFNYAITNRIATTYILPSTSNINTKQLSELHYNLSSNPSMLTLDELYMFMNHINSMPISLDSEERLIKIERWIKRKEQHETNRQNEKERQYNIAKQSYELVELMKSKGLKVIDNDNAWIYEYKGKQYKLYSTMGNTTNEKYSQFVHSIYNDCFAGMDELKAI